MPHTRPGSSRMPTHVSKVGERHHRQPTGSMADEVNNEARAVK